MDLDSSTGVFLRILRKVDVFKKGERANIYKTYILAENFLNNFKKLTFSLPKLLCEQNLVLQN